MLILGHQINTAFFRLISYNQKVVPNEGDAEETWVDEGLVALAADLVGFGAPNYEGVGTTSMLHISTH